MHLLLLIYQRKDLKDIDKISQHLMLFFLKEKLILLMMKKSITE